MESVKVLVGYEFCQAFEDFLYEFIVDLWEEDVVFLDVCILLEDSFHFCSVLILLLVLLCHHWCSLSPVLSFVDEHVCIPNTLVIYRIFASECFFSKSVDVEAVNIFIVELEPLSFFGLDIGVIVTAVSWSSVNNNSPQLVVKTFFIILCLVEIRSHYFCGKLLQW